MPLWLINAIAMAPSIASNVQGVFDAMSFLKQKDPTNYKKQYENASKLQKEAYKQSLKQLKKEYTYNKKLMSNSAKSTQALNQALMDYQYGLERDSRQTSYQDTRMDLEGAGYNPLLAVGQQSNYTPVGSGVSATSSGVEASQIGHSASQIASELAEVRNSTKTTNYLAKAQNYINDLNTAKAELTRSQTVGQDLSNKADALYKVKQAFANLNLTKAQTKQIKQDIVESGHRILNMDANTEVQKNSATSQQALMNFYKEHPKAALVFQLMNAVSGGNPLGTMVNSAGNIILKKMPVLTKVLK